MSQGKISPLYGRLAKIFKDDNHGKRIFAFSLENSWYDTVQRILKHSCNRVTLSWEWCEDKGIQISKANLPPKTRQSEVK